MTLKKSHICCCLAYETAYYQQTYAGVYIVESQCPIIMNDEEMWKEKVFTYLR
jgi:hypothetical protein